MIPERQIFPAVSTIPASVHTGVVCSHKNDIRVGGVDFEDGYLVEIGKVGFPLMLMEKTMTNDMLLAGYGNI